MLWVEGAPGVLFMVDTAQSRAVEPDGDETVYRFREFGAVGDTRVDVGKIAAIRST